METITKKQNSVVRPFVLEISTDLLIHTTITNN